MNTYSVRFVHKIAPSPKDVGPDVQLADGAFSDSRTLGKALRNAGVLRKGVRLSSFRAEADRVIVFPANMCWHSIILTLAAAPVAPPGPASGFGKETTVGDIEARIAWEQWAADTQRKLGHEPHAQAHDLTRVAYQALLAKRGA